MSGTATIAITVGVAVAILVGFFIVYYLGNVANSIYDVKVAVRKDFDKKVKELQEWVENDTKQRVKWMRDENSEQSKRFKEGVEGQLEETFSELEKSVERLRADVASLQMQILNLQSTKPTKKMPNYKTQGAGDMTSMDDAMGVPNPMFSEGEMAPDMEMTPEMMAQMPMMDRDSMQDPMDDMQRIKTKPSPPPPPASMQQAAQTAGQASVRAKANMKKKKRQDPDAFESFDQFSEDFKTGNK